MTEWLHSHWYLFGALLIQIFGTHKLKFFLPLGWGDFKRARATELIGGVLGFIAGAGMFLSVDGLMTPAGITRAVLALAPWVGLVICCAGPVLYKVAVALIYAWKPELRGTLSADEHARIRRKLVQTAAGAVVERDADAPSGDGEKTVAQFSRTVMAPKAAGTSGQDTH